MIRSLRLLCRICFVTFSAVCFIGCASLPEVLTQGSAPQASVADDTAQSPAGESAPGKSANADPSGSIAFLDQLNGFRDLKFGEPPKSSMILLEDDGDLTFYRRDSDDMKVSDGELSEITYGFYKQQLFTVTLKTKGSANSKALLTTFNSAYGAGRQPTDYLQEYYWFGTTVNATYDENLLTGDASATISNIRLSAEKNRDQKAALIENRPASPPAEHLQ